MFGAQTAGAHDLTGSLCDRQRHVGFARVEVLFDDDEKCGVGFGERVRNGFNTRNSERRSDAYAELYGFAKRQFLGAHVGNHGRVHLLDVHVADALWIFLNQRDAVAAAVGYVSGVETERNVRRVGTVEESLDVLLTFDVTIGVRVELQMYTVVAAQDLSDFGCSVREALPTCRVEVG